MQEIMRYTKITRYNSKFADILKEGEYISITEKLDGANAQFYINDNVLCLQSRNTIVDKDNTLRGFYDWVNKNIEPIKHLLNPNYRYFGEWLCQHTVQYKKEYYSNFYLFSIWDITTKEYLSDEIVLSEAKRLNIQTVPYFYLGEYISLEHIMSFIGKSEMTLEENTGEGIVVKNTKYKDKHNNQIFIKMVTEKFCEVKKINKPKENILDNRYKNIEIIKSVVTKARVEKLLYKLIDENIITSDDLIIENMGKLLKLLYPLIQEDILKEEAELLKDLTGKQLSSSMGKVLPLVLKEAILS